MDIRLAHPEEAGRIAELVATSKLPVAGLPQAWRTWVAVDGDQLLGTASLERHGDAYLLRSVAVRDDQRGRGVGAGLVRTALAAIGPHQPVALLTETAAGWFPRFGFHPVERAALNPARPPRPSSAAPARQLPRRSCAQRGSRPRTRRICAQQPLGRQLGRIGGL